MKLHAVSDGPPSLAVRMALKALNVPFELVSVNFNTGEHLTEKYAQMNPQKEIPVLEDDGFFLSEHIAILQYICNKYAPDNNLYPKDPKQRALVDHRLCFNMAFYYGSIGGYTLAPIFFDYKRDEMGLKKVHNALKTFETYLATLNTKYSAGDNLTIADFPLITATMCLEAIDFKFTEYKRISTWYETFKKEFPNLWAIAASGLEELADFEKNPPDLSSMVHPFHPIRKMNK